MSTLKEHVSALAVLFSLLLPVAASSAEVSARDIEVLRAVFARDCQLTGEKYIVVSTQPAKERDPWFPLKWNDWTLLRAELARRSGLKVDWPITRICANTRMVDQAEIEAASISEHSDPLGWARFYRIFPGSDGWTKVSLPAFSEDGSRAFVYTEHHCGNLCGGGSYLELTKDAGGWKVTRLETAWLP